MFRRVKFQITALALAIVVFIYAISAFAVYGIVRHLVLTGVDSQLSAMVQGLDLRSLETTKNSLQPGTFILVEAPRVTITNLNANQQQALDNFLARRNPHNRKYVANWNEAAHLPFRIVDLPIALDTGGKLNVVVGKDIAREMSVLSRLESVLIMVGLAGTVVSAIAGFVLAERVVRPIRTSWLRQLEFVGDASHEMRTPLAVIQSNLGLVLEHTHQSVMDNLEWIHNAHGESRRLSKLVEDLLTLARGDAQKAPLSLGTLSLSEVTQHVAELFDPVFSARELHTKVEILPNVRVNGDRDRLHQLMVILIDNACKFTPAGGTIHIRVQSQKNYALLQVSDTGCGIEDKDLSRIFDRFYQTDTSRVRTGGHGAGLGLSIAKWIVEAHKGKMTVASKVGTGTEFTVQLPLLS